MKLQNRIKETKLTLMMFLRLFTLHSISSSIFRMYSVCVCVIIDAFIVVCAFFCVIVNYYYNYYDDYCYYSVTININQANAMKMKFNAVLDGAYIHTHTQPPTSHAVRNGMKIKTDEIWRWILCAIDIGLLFAMRVLVCIHCCNCLYYHLFFALPLSLSLLHVVGHEIISIEFPCQMSIILFTLHIYLCVFF